MERFWETAELTALIQQLINRMSKRKIKVSTVNSRLYLVIYTIADLKISLVIHVDIKMIPWKFRILNSKNSGVIFIRKERSMATFLCMLTYTHSLTHTHSLAESL